MQEIWVQSLGQEELLKKEMATYSSIRVWEIPEEPGQRSLESMGLQKGLDTTERLNDNNDNNNNSVYCRESKFLPK